MDEIPQSFSNIDFSSSSNQASAIFNLLAATLQYPAPPPTKAELIDTIIFTLCESSLDHNDQTAAAGAGSSGDSGGSADSSITWDLWAVILEIAGCIPPGHEWQESMVLALGRLRRRGRRDEGTQISWKDLPDLSSSVREHWLDPSASPSPSHQEPSQESLTKWKNLNSFIARLTTTANFAPWLNLPIWQLRLALEEHPPPHVNNNNNGSPVMDCRLWVATEWVIQCAEVIFEEMSSKKELDEGKARALRMGSLCNDDGGDGDDDESTKRKKVQPLSVERWEFWRRRFKEIAARADELGLDGGGGGSTVKRISDALKRMNDVSASEEE